MKHTVATQKALSIAEHVEAVYCDGQIQEYRGNPMIEALGPIPAESDWIRMLVRKPLIDPAERLLPTHLRTHLLPRLMSFFFPLRQHLELAQRIDLMLRRGYVHRNPLTKGRVEVLRKVYELHQEGRFSEAPAYAETGALLCTTLCGISGGGKSTTTETALAHYPQLIRHPEHGIFQVVWLKVSCPSNGSLSGLCAAILEAFDRLLGTHFAPRPGSRLSADDLLREVASVALTYNLGLLVIDEIQNVSIKRNGGREVMLNFFQNLANDLRLPVLLIGTMKAISMLEESFRTARRAAAMGSMQWSLMPCDAQWHGLIKTMWKFQWVRNPVPFSEEISVALHEASAGVIALATTMFALAQLCAMRDRLESVDASMLKRVAEAEFMPLKPLLEALRSGDLRRIAKYDDMMPSGMWERVRQQIDTFAVNSPPSSQEVSSGKDDWTRAMVALIALGFPQADVESALNRARSEGAKTMHVMVREAMIMLQRTSASSEEDPQDLRRLAEKVPG